MKNEEMVLMRDIDWSWKERGCECGSAVGIWTVYECRIRDSSSLSEYIDRFSKVGAISGCIEVGRDWNF